ncbi:hypothetical protein LCGC14_0951640 [marine sediment metagenome]|uniref:Uncharacterized protein n=1 Tax=marine sediment metagenome TaxID=412755 RepID=A0A0F9NH67_9ZZZZ
MKTVSFHGTCTAGSTKVLVSRHIGHPYEVNRIRARFAQGCNNTLKMAFYISPDKDEPAAGAPTGVSMLQDYGQVDYVVGNDDTKDMQHNVLMSESGSYLKVYAQNSDTFDHSIDAQVTIEEKGRS